MPLPADFEPLAIFPPVVPPIAMPKQAMGPHGLQRFPRSTRFQKRLSCCIGDCMRQKPPFAFFTPRGIVRQLAPQCFQGGSLQDLVLHDLQGLV